MAAQLDAACEPSDGEQQPRAVLVRVHAPDSADEYVEHEFASAFEAAQWAHGRAAGRVRRTRVLYSGRGTIQSGCSGSRQRRTPPPTSPLSGSPRKYVTDLPSCYSEGMVQQRLST